MMLRWALPLLLLLVGGCSTFRVVRLDTSYDSLVVTPYEAGGAELEAV
ncbi:hypothetical protein [Pyxidicoccus trucidator]|nr:hypothetical protein [Pyxidicoccus trucidator]